MKRILTLLLALGVCAATSASETGQQQATGAAAAPQATQTQDSPLVAAAKRANRKGRKATNVITNETLAKSGAGAHITTTATQRPFVAPKPYEAPAPTPEMVAMQVREAEKRRAAEQAEAQKKAEETQKRAAAAAAAASEEGVYDDEEVDPAQAEKTQGEANRKPPQR